MWMSTDVHIHKKIANFIVGLQINKLCCYKKLIKRKCHTLTWKTLSNQPCSYNNLINKHLIVNLNIYSTYTCNFIVPTNFFPFNVATCKNMQNSDNKNGKSEKFIEVSDLQVVGLPSWMQNRWNNNKHSMSLLFFKTINHALHHIHFLQLHRLGILFPWLNNPISLFHQNHIKQIIKQIYNN